MGNSPAKELATLMPRLPLSCPSKIPSTRFLVPLAERAAWSWMERRTRGWTTTEVVEVVSWSVVAIVARGRWDEAVRCE